jgi:thiamine-phosphate pyrophosphorylase
MASSEFVSRPSLFSLPENFHLAIIKRFGRCKYPFAFSVLKMFEKVGRLHVLTDTLLQSRFSHVELAEMAIAGGADAIQFRQKQGPTRELIWIATQMKRACADKGVAFIVNDRIDVAIAAQADGVHLGQDDFPIPLARKLVGKQCIIGGSAATLEEAQKCLADGADYVGFGPVFPTGSKDDAGPVSGVETLKMIVKTIPLPIIAIGGIGPANAHAVMEAGAHGIAVISAVCCQDDPCQATIGLCGLLQPVTAGGCHA